VDFPVVGVEISDAEFWARIDAAPDSELIYDNAAAALMNNFAKNGLA
jgi:hypothetical protein